MSNMIDNIEKHIAEVKAFVASNRDEIESFRIRFLGKKGILNEYFAAFKDVPADGKKS